MAVILAMVYQKKLGLPNYSSHSCSVSVTVEIADVSLVAQESSKLYALLQTAVDGEIQQVGYMPDQSTYGMKTNGNGANGHQHNGNGHSPANGDTWSCTDGQKGLILRIVNESNLKKDDVERMAQDLFGRGGNPSTRCRHPNSSRNSSIKRAKAKVNGGNGTAANSHGHDLHCRSIGECAGARANTR